jgi:hypothetical protein
MHIELGKVGCIEPGVGKPIGILPSALGRVDEISPKQFRCYLNPLRVSHAADLIARKIGFDRLENFRLSPPRSNRYI